MIRKLLLLTLTLIVAIITGCGKTDTTGSKDSKDVTFEGTSYTVPKDPKHIAVLSNSLLTMLDKLGVQPIARVTTSEKLPENLDKIPSVGHTASINVEQLIGLKPDLVLGLVSQHNKFKDQLQSNHLDTVLINYEGIKDNVPLITFLGEITNTQEQAAKLVKHYNEQVEKVKASVKDKQPVTVAVLRATGKGVTAETDQAITASMVKELGMDNKVLHHLTTKGKEKTMPYSLETLTEDNPDIIFVVTMGKQEDITKSMAKAMTDNPAWNNLTAVKNNRVIYLPSNLFLLNPGLDTPTAMAKLVEYAYGFNPLAQ